MMELNYASATWLHSLGILLVIGRLAHFRGIEIEGKNGPRAAGIVATWLMQLIASGWLLYTLLIA